MVLARYNSLSIPVNVARGFGAHGFGFRCLDFASFALDTDVTGFAGD
jgi:hypothetical protein